MPSASEIIVFLVSSSSKQIRNNDSAIMGKRIKIENLKIIDPK